MRAPLTSSLFLAVVFAVTICLASANSVEPEEEIKPNPPCTVRVWVRAEDLSPNHVSRGELRIKAPQKECAQQIASVALRLQLDEFGEFKHLKEGAVLPEVLPSNESASTEYTSWMGDDVVYNYQAHDDGLSDPELWTIMAEERRAWTTEAILLQDPDLSEPIITPFTVAVPAVDYPAVVEKYRGHVLAGRPFAQHSFSDLSYRYIAIITFSDGHTENILAGYTAFIPSSGTDAGYQPPSAPFTRNVTFENPCTGDNPRQKEREQMIEKCLPRDQRSVFAAEVTVESGKTVAQGLSFLAKPSVTEPNLIPGQTLKGRVAIHTLKDGATTLSDIYVSVEMISRDRWAEAQTSIDGDSACSSIGSAPCQTFAEQLSSESNGYSSVFTESGGGDWSNISLPHNGAHGVLTSSDPHFSFALEIPRQAPVDFVSYYSSIENLLQLDLTVLYSVDVARCIHSRPIVESLEKEEDAATTEDGLWDMWTPVGESSVSPFKYFRSLTMEATLPITIVRSEPSKQATANYLLPKGAVAPVLRSGLQMDMPASFPSAEPFFVVEDIVNTSARLMRPGSTDLSLRRNGILTLPDYPDPTKNYRRGNYVGVLWKKKEVAEERGIWPSRDEKVLHEGDSQRPLTDPLS
ncbi:hypothetical protein R3P38DRAFT_3194049 [Favolaschia claudopus]|uniref:Uncharacterized protein n=1 Tax=Favolaschia claudopus TaxID=2862362 RepID=A0AAW0BFQ6_9AGAR